MGKDTVIVIKVMLYYSVGNYLDGDINQSFLTEKALQTKRKKLKSLRSPSVEYALELSKQILHSPTLSTKSPCQESSSTTPTTEKKCQNPSTDTNHLLAVKDNTKSKRGTLKASKVSSFT